MIENQILENRIVFTAIVLMMSRILTVTFINHMYIQALLLSISTIIHEVCHFVVGLLLNGKPTSFSILPTKNYDENRIQLGSVRFVNLNWYNRIPIGLAPLLIFIFIYYFDLYFFIYFEKNLINTLLYIYLLSILLINSIPSKTDLKIAFSCITGIIFYGLIFVIFYKLFEKGLL